MGLVLTLLTEFWSTLCEMAPYLLFGFMVAGVLMRRKRLVVDFAASGFISLLLQSRNFHIQGISPEIAEMSVNFGSQISNDPADRLIAATSVLRNAPVVTADRNLRDAPMVETIW